MAMRCTNCWKDIEENFPDVVYNEWLKLSHYFQHELNEEEITEATYESMMDALMSVKPEGTYKEANDE